MPYEGPLRLHVRESTGKPTHSFVFLHGYACTGKENADHFQSWSHANTTTYRGLRVICPTAFSINTSAPGYTTEPVNSWYDFEDGTCTSADDKPDIVTLNKSCSEIHEIIKAEAEIVGSTSRVFVGGVSQGCGAALHAVSTAPFTIGGFYGSIGHVMPCTDVSNIDRLVAGPIVFYNGANDDVMTWSWVKKTFARLNGKPRVEIWREEGVKHEDDGHWLANFLIRVLPPPSVNDQLFAYDELDIALIP